MVESEDFRVRNRARYQEFLDSLPHVLTDIEAASGQSTIAPVFALHKQKLLELTQGVKKEEPLAEARRKSTNRSIQLVQ